MDQGKGRATFFLNGCVSVISMDTGKVLEVEPMSRNCKQCQAYHKLDKESQKFTEWKNNHTDCNANFIGSAPTMEQEDAIRMFTRSFEKHSLYYTKIYSDGDGKSYPSVENIYSDVGKCVSKQECIGHVQKQMRTALRKLKRERKNLGGKGKLTDKTIDKIQDILAVLLIAVLQRRNNMIITVLRVRIHGLPLMWTKQIK